MAKGQKTTSKNKESNFIKKTTAFFKDDKVRVVLGVVTVFFSLYLLFAFVSYLFTWKIDQSKLDLPFATLIGDAEIGVRNWAGKTGAAIASTFIHNWFGLASFSVVFLLFLFGLRMMRIRLLPLRKTVKFTIIITIWLSISLSFLFVDKYFYLGGAHGYFISNWLNATLGKIGTLFLLLIMLIAFILFTFDKALGLIISFIKNLFSKSKEQDDTDFPDEEIDSNLFKEESEDASEEDVEAEEGLEHDAEEPPKIETIIEIPEKEESTVSEKILEIQHQVTPEEKDDNENIEFTIEDAASEDELVTKNLANIENEGDYDPTLDLSHYKYPPLELLIDHRLDEDQLSQEELENILKENNNRIIETLGHYKIEISKISATVGPTVTLYEIVPAPGIRISKIKNLEDDIALSLAALGIRIIAPMPGKGTIGIEVPNPKPGIVSMRSIISSKVFQESKFELPIALGKTISNETFVVDLAKMPHCLVAGATGQGKSVGINAIITSLLYKKHPAQLKFVLIDPKKVELSIYARIENHFLAKLPDTEEAIITDTAKVVNTMNSLCVEMDQRYDLLKAADCRNIKEYNAKFIKRKLNPNKNKYLPYIVVIIDEFADLIMTAGKEIETPIARLAQLARAIGIHLIVATQRPSANIITGVIKANFPTRIAFKVSSAIDSRTILDSSGANQLIGRGDMLITKGSDLIRVQCAFIDTPEVDCITDHISQQQSYTSAFMLPEIQDDNDEFSAGSVDLKKRDSLFDEAARLIVSHQQGSTSLIQRKFSIGYNRAGKLIDQLEAAGIVGPYQGSKARDVNVVDLMSLEQILNSLDSE